MIAGSLQSSCDIPYGLINLTGAGHALEGSGISFIGWGEMPMQYVTYDNLIQLGLLIVSIIGLVYKICHKDKK